VITSVEEIIAQIEELTKVGCFLLMMDVVEGRCVDEETRQHSLDPADLVAAVEIEIEEDEAGDPHDLCMKPDIQTRNADEGNSPKGEEGIDGMDGKRSEGGREMEGVVVATCMEDRKKWMVHGSVFEVHVEINKECDDDETNDVEEDTRWGERLSLCETEFDRVGQV
jgi:hypothetical protein